MEARVATERDLDAVTEVLTAAFESDPVWGWAFPDRADLEVWWRFNIPECAPLALGVGTGGLRRRRDVDPAR